MSIKTTHPCSLRHNALLQLQKATESAVDIQDGEEREAGAMRNVPVEVAELDHLPFVHTLGTLNAFVLQGVQRNKPPHYHHFIPADHFDGECHLRVMYTVKNDSSLTDNVPPEYRGGDGRTSRSVLCDNMNDRLEHLLTNIAEQVGLHAQVADLLSGENTPCQPNHFRVYDYASPPLGDDGRENRGYYGYAGIAFPKEYLPQIREAVAEKLREDGPVPPAGSGSRMVRRSFPTRP